VPIPPAPAARPYERCAEEVFTHRCLPETATHARTNSNTACRARSCSRTKCTSISCGRVLRRQTIDRNAREVVGAKQALYPSQPNNPPSRQSHGMPSEPAVPIERFNTPNHLSTFDSAQNAALLPRDMSGCFRSLRRRASRSSRRADSRARPESCWLPARGTYHRRTSAAVAALS
jgi:hypothetical protein